MISTSNHTTAVPRASAAVPQNSAMLRHLLLFTALVGLTCSVQAGSSGSAELFVPAGQGAGTGNGDFISDDNGLDTFYSYWIEVPPSTNTLTIQIFDADIGAGGAGENTSGSVGRDRQRGGSHDTACDYILRNPAGATIQTRTITAGAGAGNVNVPLDNVWTTIFNNPSPAGALTNPAAGHWEVRVRMGIDGNDLNAFGIRAFNGAGNEGSTGTELNIYYRSFTSLGVNPTLAPKFYTSYPMVSAGCACRPYDFDWDTDAGNTGNFTLTSRLGTFSSSTNALSANDVWVTRSITGYATDARATDYGLWRAVTRISPYVNVAGNNGNYGVIYFGNEFTANPNPTAQPQALTYRTYLSTDAIHNVGGVATAPLKPWLAQALDYSGVGPNPPAVGQTTRIRVTISVVNPTGQPIVFNNANTNRVQSFVPAATLPAIVNYAGLDGTPTQGTVVAQPALNGNGNVQWDPGTLAANSTATLQYFVNVRPGSSGQRLPVTGTGGGTESVANFFTTGTGTRARWIDETGNTTQAQARIAFGPLCELAVTEGSAPLFVELLDFAATANEPGAPVLLTWETGVEVDNAGFYLSRARLDEMSIYAPAERLNATLIPGSADSDNGGALYSYTDLEPWNPAEIRGYFLSDVDINGTVTHHGPVFVNSPGVTDMRSLVGNWMSYGN